MADAPGAAPGATPGAVPASPGAPAVATQSGMTDNMASALCYLLGLLTGILFLVLEPYNKNKVIRFHAFQSLFFNVAYIGVWIVVMILSIALGALPVVGWIFSTLLYIAVMCGFFITWILLMYKAYNNEKLVLPIIGALAEKQA